MINVSTCDADADADAVWTVYPYASFNTKRIFTMIRDGNPRESPFYF